MVKWRIDTLTPQEIAKYRQRSSNAINGIEYLLKYANVIAQYEKISDKYKTIAEYIGLGQEGGNSFYNGNYIPVVPEYSYAFLIILFNKYVYLFG